MVFLPVVFMREVGVKSSHKLTEWALKRKEKKYIRLEEQSVSVFSVLYKGKRAQLIDFDKKLHQQTVSSPVGEGGGGRGDSLIKVTGMFFFSLRGANCRFWSHLGCLGWNVTIYLPI